MIAFLLTGFGGLLAATGVAEAVLVTESVGDEGVAVVAKCTTAVMSPVAVTAGSALYVDR
jgi:hypothetical protein